MAVFGHASGTAVYTVTNPEGELIFPANSNNSQSFTLTGSVHGTTKSVHGAGRLFLELGATIRSSQSFSVDDRRTRGNS